MNHKMRRKDKESSFNNTSAEALTARGINFNYRNGKGDLKKFKIGIREELKKNHYAFYKEERHW